ncbi:MAG: HEAT repeat domain-containing protein [Planctomycetales bacterium]
MTSFIEHYRDAMRNITGSCPPERTEVRYRLKEQRPGCAVPQALHDFDRLLDAAGDPDLEIRRRAVMWLVQPGRWATKAVPTLIKSLADDDDQTKWHAASALGEYCEQGYCEGMTDEAVAGLVECLASTPPDTIPLIMRSLSKFGSRASSALPALKQLENHESFLVGTAVADAILAITKQP